MAKKNIAKRYVDTVSGGVANFAENHKVITTTGVTAVVGVFTYKKVVKPIGRFFAVRSINKSMKKFAEENAKKTEENKNEITMNTNESNEKQAVNS